MNLTLLECQQSPCFFCKKMSTEVRDWSEGLPRPVRVVATCAENRPEFPASKCDLYTQDKSHD